MQSLLSEEKTEIAGYPTGGYTYYLMEQRNHIQSKQVASQIILFLTPPSKVWVRTTSHLMWTAAAVTCCVNQLSTCTSD